MTDNISRTIISSWTK